VISQEQELSLALGVKKVTHGSHQFRVMSRPHVETDLLEQVKSFLVQMTLELYLHRRAKRIYGRIWLYNTRGFCGCMHVGTSACMRMCCFD
jgi:hypothetical protein